MAFPTNWNGEAQRNLNRIVRMTVAEALAYPETATNPIAELRSEVLYDPDLREYVISARASNPNNGDFYRSSAREAEHVLRQAWGREIYDGSRADVVELINGPYAFMASEYSDAPIRP